VSSTPSPPAPAWAVSDPQLYQDALIAFHFRSIADSFSPKLTGLDLLMDERFTRNMQQWTVYLAEFNPNLTRLNIALPPPHDPSIDITGLLQLKHLKQLYLNQIVLVDSHFAVLREMASLELLSASGICWSPEQLAALCRPPHKLQQLHTIATRFPRLTAAHCAELMHLPALSSLAFASLDAGAAALLPRFPALQVLDFCCGPDFPLEVAFAALCACTNLTELTLHTTFTLAANAELFLALASLRKLTLTKLAINDLSFLEPQQKTQRVLPLLESLTLRGCISLRSSQLTHVVSPRALPSLTHLAIIDSFTPPLDEFARAMLRTPSRLMPQLNTFVCEDSRPML
jgi:hypothetical protein